MKTGAGGRPTEKRVPMGSLPAGFLTSLHEEEGLQGRCWATGGEAAGRQFWKSLRLVWVWEKVLRQREWRRCQAGHSAKLHQEHQVRKNQVD